MNTTLYRPVGLKELNLIETSGMTRFPPRLPWQPIFYPVLNEQYAIEIASQWNVNDEAGGYCGFVLEFDIATDYFKLFDVQNVGSQHHNELWVPATELDEFNRNIIGLIRVTKAFYGEKYVGLKKYAE